MMHRNRIVRTMRHDCIFRIPLTAVSKSKSPYINMGDYSAGDGLPHSLADDRFGLLGPALQQIRKHTARFIVGNNEALESAEALRLDFGFRKKRVKRPSSLGCLLLDEVAPSGVTFPCTATASPASFRESDSCPCRK